jgi:hypothetical protein
MQLGKATRPPYHGLQRHLSDAWIQSAGDPDISLPVWLQSGAPLGLTVPVKRHGIFPTVQRQQPPRAIDGILTPEGEWSYYRSAENDLPICNELLQRMLDNHWARPFDTKEELHEYLDATEIILNKLARVAKTKPDGTTKHRPIWDFLRSHVNSRIHQGERIVLPRVSDFIEGVLLDAYGSVDTYKQPHFQDNTSIWLFGIDISDAFSQVPLNNKEKRFAVAFVNDKFWVFHCLVFGSGSAPTAWGKFAAFLGRSTAALANDNFHLQIYVGDPAFLPGNNAPRRHTVRNCPPMGYHLGLPICVAQSRRGRERNVDRRDHHHARDQWGSFFPAGQLRRIGK